MLYPFVFILLSFIFMKPVCDSDIEYPDLPSVIYKVLSQTYYFMYPQLFPYIKLVWVVCLIAAFCGWNSLFCLFGFVSMMLLGIFQSMGDIEEWDYVWLVSNTVAMVYVAGYFIYELIVRENQFKSEYLHKNRLWLLLFFPILIWYPVVCDNMQCKWDFSLYTLIHSEGGAAFCYVSPTLLSILLLYYPHVNRRLVGILTLVCSIFGVSAIVLFMSYNQIPLVILHIPLLVVSLYGYYLYFFGNDIKEKKE